MNEYDKIMLDLKIELTGLEYSGLKSISFDEKYRIPMNLFTVVKKERDRIIDNYFQNYKSDSFYVSPKSLNGSEFLILRDFFLENEFVSQIVRLDSNNRINLGQTLRHCKEVDKDWHLHGNRNEIIIADLETIIALNK